MGEDEGTIVIHCHEMNYDRALFLYGLLNSAQKLVDEDAYSLCLSPLCFIKRIRVFS